MKIYKICFSPTGGTQKIMDILSGPLGGECVSVDLTNPNTMPEKLFLSADDLAVIAVPSYGGRAPQTAVERLLRINGNGARAVLVCVYGNRAYEDTLAELEDAARQAGFAVVAAVAAVAEHSVVREFAAGRPDARDRQSLTDFAHAIRSRLESGTCCTPKIPGNRPYKTAHLRSNVPQAGPDCTRCGRCAAACPVCAIDPADPASVNAELCISCMRCVSICPQNARKVPADILEGIRAMLQKVCTERRENELFL